MLDLTLLKASLYNRILVDLLESLMAIIDFRLDDTVNKLFAQRFFTLLDDISKA